MGILGVVIQPLMSFEKLIANRAAKITFHWRRLGIFFLALQDHIIQGHIETVHGNLALRKRG